MKSTDQRNGFTSYILSNNALRIEVVPQLGAKIISFQSVKTGREWMWRPQPALSLFRNAVGDSFETSTLVGADECFPTIGSCVWKGRNLPDHGEAWASAWDLDGAAFSRNFIRTTLRLPISPFSFERTISLHEEEAQFDYVLKSHSSVPERFLWAFHPLFAIEAGDRLELSSGIHEVQVGAVSGFPDSTAKSWSWPRPFPDVRLDWIDFHRRAPAYAKLFADMSRTNEGFAAITRDNERLSFRFDRSAIPALGIWFTGGAWHGHTHMAIEPTNSASETLDNLRENARNVVPPLAEMRWQFRIQVSRIE